MKKVLVLAVCCVLIFAVEGFSLDFMKKAGSLLSGEKKTETPAAPEKQASGLDKATNAVSAAQAKTHQAKAGFSILVPGGWEVKKDEAGELQMEATSQTGVVVSIILNDYGKDFPVEASITAYLEQAKKEKGDGAIDNYEETLLGGAKGVLRFEKTPAGQDDPQRITFQGYAGSVGINIVASARANDFAGSKDILQAIVRSCKW